MRICNTYLTIIPASTVEPRPPLLLPEAHEFPDSSLDDLSFRYPDALQTAGDIMHNGS